MHEFHLKIQEQNGQFLLLTKCNTLSDISKVISTHKFITQTKYICLGLERLHTVKYDKRSSEDIKQSSLPWFAVVFCS
jgi:hypothetical protein